MLRSLIERILEEELDSGGLCRLQAGVVRLAWKNVSQRDDGLTTVAPANRRRPRRDCACSKDNCPAWRTSRRAWVSSAILVGVLPTVMMPSSYRTPRVSKTSEKGLFFFSSGLTAHPIGLDDEGCMWCRCLPREDCEVIKVTSDD